jgi:hypothetical protein
MNGVYTNLAKKRAEQSTELRSQSSVPPLLEKPAIQEAQVTEETTEPKQPGNLETRKQVSKETRKSGNAQKAATEAQGFDLNIKPYRKGTYLFTDEELYAIDDLKKDLKRRMDLSSTQYDIVRSAVHSIVEDFRQRGEESFIVQHIRKKKSRS